MLLFLIFTYLLLISFPTSPEFYSTRCFSFTVLPIITLHIVDSIANSSLPSLLAPISHKRRSCLATWSEEHGRRSLKRVAIHNLQKTRIYKIPPKRERATEIRLIPSYLNTLRRVPLQNQPILTPHLKRRPPIRHRLLPRRNTYPRRIISLSHHQTINQSQTLPPPSFHPKLTSRIHPPNQNHSSRHHRLFLPRRTSPHALLHHSHPVAEVVFVGYAAGAAVGERCAVLMLSEMCAVGGMEVRKMPFKVIWQ